MESLPQPEEHGQCPAEDEGHARLSRNVSLGQLTGSKGEKNLPSCKHAHCFQPIELLCTEPKWSGSGRLFASQPLVADQTAAQELIALWIPLLKQK